MSNPGPCGAPALGFGGMTIACCGNMGHKNNADCFVGARDKEGKVTAWVPHGAACAVCIDIAVESMRMRNSGASVAAIRKQVQDEYRPHFPSSETPTPAPPPGR